MGKFLLQKEWELQRSAAADECQENDCKPHNALKLYSAGLVLRFSIWPAINCFCTTPGMEPLASFWMVLNNLISLQDNLNLSPRASCCRYCSPVTVSKSPIAGANTFSDTVTTAARKHQDQLSKVIAMDGLTALKSWKDEQLLERILKVL